MQPKTKKSYIVFVMIHNHKYNFFLKKYNFL